MPVLTGPALPTGHLRSTVQPRLAVDRSLVLRPWRPGDVAAVRAAFGCPDIQRWHVRRIDDDDEAGAWIAGWAGRWTAETAASWAVADGADDRVLGQVGLRTVDLFEACAQLSYWMLPSARGAGVAGRAVGALTRWAFDTVGLHRLVVQHSVANAASCRVADRAGFAAEGTLRGSGRHADGWHDMHVHARLAGTAAVGR